MSERRACDLVLQPWGTQRYRPTQRADEDALTQAIVTLAGRYGRYGYRRITALLQRGGWKVGKDRVERIWRREGLKYHRSRSREADCGGTMGRVFACVQNAGITFGVGIL